MILSSFRDRLKDNGHPAVAVSLLALLSSEGKNAVKSPLTEKLLDMTKDIRVFIAEHETELKTKEKGN
jgi:hypothetical protein